MLFVLEAPPRFELGNKGFADLCLTTWLWRHIAVGDADYIIIFPKRNTGYIDNLIDFRIISHLISFVKRFFYFFKKDFVGNFFASKNRFFT